MTFSVKKRLSEQALLTLAAQLYSILHNFPIDIEQRTELPGKNGNPPNASTYEVERTFVIGHPENQLILRQIEIWGETHAEDRLLRKRLEIESAVPARLRLQYQDSQLSGEIHAEKHQEAACRATLKI